uniref:Uncharacterized protein n=1 Tax=Romanomermis culicivorax TaxID=13658 RepID=A0A915ID12_ROMCU
MKNPKGKSTVRVLDQREYSIFCAHGPCLLFERKKKDSAEVQQFYACSVYRNRKLCNFYLTEKDVERKREKYRQEPSDNSKLICHGETSIHNGHKLEWGITNAQLKNPTKLMTSIDNKDAESAQFYSPRSFAQYNMVANYFYGSHSVEKLESFFQSVNRLLIVVDPPFGTLCCQIAKSVKFLEETFAVKRKASNGVDNNLKNCECIWISPYFLQPKIIENYPQIKMLAYQSRQLLKIEDTIRIFEKSPDVLICTMSIPDTDTHGKNFPPERPVDFRRVKKRSYSQLLICVNISIVISTRANVQYENHPNYTMLSKEGSPIRIFTTLSPSVFVLVDNKYKCADT